MEPLASPPPPPSGQPAAVDKAVKILYGVLAVNVAWMLVNWIVLGKYRSGLFVSNSALCWFLLGWLISRIDEGKNWARITYLVAFVLGNVLAFYPVPTAWPHLSAGVILLRVVLTALDTIGVVLLLSRDADDWFRRMAPPLDGGLPPPAPGKPEPPPFPKAT